MCEVDNCENKSVGQSCVFCYWNNVNNSGDYNLFSSGFNNEHHPRNYQGLPKYANVFTYEQEVANAL